MKGFRSKRSDPQSLQTGSTRADTTFVKQDSQTDNICIATTGHKNVTLFGHCPLEQVESPIDYNEVSLWRSGPRCVPHGIMTLHE